MSAEESVHLLEGEGYPAFWIKSENERGTWFLVYTGPYDVKDLANHDMKLLKESGVKKVHVRITSPPVKHPCFYGMNFAYY